MEWTLGDRELDVMAALWSDGPGTVAEVQARLGVDLAYNTVLTILRNLEQKRLVRHTAEGRLHRYSAAVAEGPVRGKLLSRLVDKVFAGSSIGLVTHLVEEGQLSQTELRELHQLLNSQVGRGRGGKRYASEITTDDSHRATARQKPARRRR